MGLGDFCQDPVNNTLQALQHNTTNYATVHYYATCSGTSPFADDLQSARNYYNTFETNSATLQAACPGNVYVNNMVAELPPINSSLTSIGQHTACGPYQQHFDSILYHGICHSGVYGFFTVWIGQFIVAFCLFLLAITASIHHQYYGKVVEPYTMVPGDPTVHEAVDQAPALPPSAPPVPINANESYDV
jgi:hypothetical protein